MLIGESRPREGGTGLCPSAACLLVVTEFLETAPNSHYPTEETLQQPAISHLLTEAIGPPLQILWCIWNEV